MGGMFTILKVRDNPDREDGPGWYEHPAGTVADVASADDLAARTIRTRSANRVSPGHRCAREVLGSTGHTSARRSRSAFAITDTELKLIAAAAIIGLSRRPNAGIQHARGDRHAGAL